MTKFNKDDNDPVIVSEAISMRLFANHIHFLSGDIDESSISRAMQWLIYENLQYEKNKILTLYINSDGGSLNDAFGLIDLMRESKHPIRTIGVGSVMSAAFLILSAGTEGMRYVSKNTSCMCHQFSDELQGKFHDIKSSIKEIDNTNQRMLNLLVETTGLSKIEVKRKLLPADDIWLKPEELVAMNVADHILGEDEI